MDMVLERNGTHSKADIPLVEEIRDQSVQPRASEGINSSVPALPITRWTFIQNSSTTLPAWWSPARDRALSEFWKSVNLLSGAMYAMVSKLVTIPFRVLPRDSTISSHMDIAQKFERRLYEGAEFGEGWTTFFSKQLESLLGQDNGRFMEIIDASPNKDGPILGAPLSVAHLDPVRCQRTGDPDYPILYQATDGSLHKLHWTRVAYSAQLPSERADMLGVGMCLTRDSTVLMEDGSYRKIVKLIEEKSTDRVASIDETGKIVYKRITNWYKNSLNGRKLVNIRGKYSKLCRGVKQRNSWVTEDHPILTPLGWVNANGLNSGDRIVTGLPAPNRKQMEFLVGSLLGDGTVTQLYDRARFSVGHSIKQKEWFDIKESVLKKDFGFSSRTRWSTCRIDGRKPELLDKLFHLCYGETHCHASFIELRKKFYPNGKKYIDFDFIKDYATPLCFATWYMDDGNICDREPGLKNRRPHARISCSSRSPEEVDALCDFLKLGGYECSKISNRGDGTKSRNIRILTESSQKFFDDIAPYIPESMRYKLPKDSTPYDASLWDLGSAEAFIDEVEIVDRMPPRCSSVYCIDVEDTHNFITAGIVVHNCAVSRAASYAQNMFDISLYKEEKLGSRPKRGIMLVGGGLDAEAVGEALAVTDGMTDARNLRRFSTLPIVGSPDITEPSINLVELSTLPDGFDEESSTTIAMAAIALAFGVDARELWPSTQSGATRADAILSHIKQRGKGPGQILAETERMFNTWYLPPYLKMVFDFQDDAQDRQRAEISRERSLKRKNDISMLVTNDRTEREFMVAEGEMSTAQFAYLELNDGRLPSGKPLETLFYVDDPIYSEVLTIPGVSDPLDILGNDAQTMLGKISSQKSIAYRVLARETSDNKSAKAREAFAALESLERMYQNIGETQQKPQPQLPASENRQGVREGPKSNPEDGSAINVRPSDEENLMGNENSPREAKGLLSMILPNRKNKEKRNNAILDTLKQALDIEDAPILVSVPQPEVVVNVPEQKQVAPVVNVAPPVVNIPEQKPPIVNVAAPNVSVHVPKQEPPIINVELPKGEPRNKSFDNETIEVTRDEFGKIVSLNRRKDNTD